MDSGTQTDELYDTDEVILRARQMQLEQKVERSRTNLAQYFEKATLSAPEPLSKLPVRAESPVQKTPVERDFKDTKHKGGHAWFVELDDDINEAVKQSEIPPIPKYTPKKAPVRVQLSSKNEPTSARKRTPGKFLHHSARKSVAEPVSSKKQSVGTEAKRDLSSDMLSLKDLYRHAGTNTDSSSLFSSKMSQSEQSGHLSQSRVASQSASVAGNNSKISVDKSNSRLDSKFLTEDSKSQYSSNFSSEFREFSKSMAATSQKSSKMSSAFDEFAKSIDSRSEFSSSQFSKSVASSIPVKPVPFNSVYYLAQEFMASPVLECLESQIVETRSTLDSISKSMLSFDI